MRRPSRLKQPQPETKLKTVCAWCSQVMSPGQMPVSHGICRSCTAVHLEIRHDAVVPASALPSQA